jgi:Na+/proline symporter
MNRWMDRRSPWQFALICGASMMAGSLLGTATMAAWHGGPVNLGPLIGAFLGSIVVAVIALWNRQRREDANTVAEWVESRRPPLP